jgi:hypothetical protein
MVAVDVHVSERSLRRPPNVSCWIDPVALGELAVQTAPAHIRLLKELMTAPINTPIMNARL